MEVNVLATLLFVITALAMAFVVWQQRRAEKLAATRPDDEELEPLPGPAGRRCPRARPSVACAQLADDRREEPEPGEERREGDDHDRGQVLS